MRRMQTLNARNMRRLGQHGQPMKGEQGHTESGGGQSGGSGNPPPNNQGGNSGAGGGSGGNQNNSGNGFNAETFWEQPSPAPSPSPNSGSAGSGESGGGQPQNEGNAFAERLTNLKFGDSVFTPDAIKAMNEGGDPAVFNQNMSKFGQQAVRESVVMAAQLMQRNNQMMESRMVELLDERFGRRDAESDLGKSFPSYEKPGMKPMIDGIFAQAMKLSGGNRAKAIEATKEMLRYTHSAAGEDLGLTTPPGGQGDGLGTQTNWEEELLGR